GAGATRLLADLYGRSAGGGNDPVISLPPWTTGVDDVLAVRRPGRIFLVLFRERQLFEGAGPEIDGPDIFLASSRRTEHERGTIARPLRLEVIGRVLRDLRPQRCPQVVDPDVPIAGASGTGDEPLAVRR